MPRPPFPPFPVETTLLGGGRLHFWHPARPAAKVADWVFRRVGDRWPGGAPPPAETTEATIDGAAQEGLTLEPLAAAAALAACVPPPRSPDRRASSMRFWVLANRFLLGLLSRGRFRPAVRALSRRNGRPGGAALWLPDFASHPRELDALRLAAPERAFASPDREPALAAYFSAAGDAIVRDAARRLGGAGRSARAASEPVEAALDDLLSPESARLADRNGDDLRRIAAALGDPAAGGGDADAPETPVVFVLEPPPAAESASGGRWRLRFGLSADRSGANGSGPDGGAGDANGRARDRRDDEPNQEPNHEPDDRDDGALLPLSEVWGTLDPVTNLHRFGAADPALPLLRALGRAARACPLLERGLRDEAPEQVEITAAEAYEFLHQGQDALRRIGYPVRVPEALAGKRTRKPTLRLTIRPAGQRGAARGRGSGGGRGPHAGLGLDTLMDYRWRVEVGSHSWSLEEFRRLTRGRRRLVRAGNEWVEFDHDQVDRVLHELGRRRARSGGRPPALRDALRERLLAGAPPARSLFDDEDLPAVSAIEGENWVGELFAALEAAASELGEAPPPSGLRTELRPYQRVGYSWLRLLADHGLGGCLADDMGLGKTCQALAFLLGEQEAGRLARPYLLVCPNSIVANWRKEAERFAPSLRLHVRQGAKRSRGEEFERRVAESDLVVCSFGITHRDFDLLDGVSWGGLIVDEAQNLKNPGAKQTRAVRRLTTPVRFALTGTPLENRLTDLWSIMEFLNPGFLGPERTFRRAFTAAVEGGQDPEATAQLRRLVSPFVLRRVKTDPKVIRDLPEKHQARVYCSLTGEQAALYQAAVDQCAERIEASRGITRHGEILRTLTRLKQICNHPENLLRTGGPLEGRSGKLIRLTEILFEVGERGERSLVFTQFAEMARLLAEHLSGLFDREIPVLHGGAPVAERDEIVTDFQESEDAPPVLVLSLKTGGYGLNLTRASHVVHYDRWWNPAVENQATDRAFRIGQRKRVLVHKFLCAGTLEERIADLLERKTALAESVIGGGESWLASLNPQAFRKVIALDPEAVAE